MGSLNLPHASSFKGGSETFLRNVLESILKTYLMKNPTVKTIWELVQSMDNEKICYDHFTFRTFKVDGYGIDSLSSFFMDYGYKIGGELEFSKNKSKVKWFSPPDVHVPHDGHGLTNGPLPRIVIAEVLLDQLSPESQGVIRKYLKPEGGKQAVLSSTLGSLIWEKPTWNDFKQLAKENEFAAWTLIHGYTMNHLAFSVHRFKHQFSDIKFIKQYLEEKEFKLNTDGGVIKVSQDGLLLQVSSIADKLAFKDVPFDEIKEFHRREGFELDNASNIMESTRFTAPV
ncbi:Uncharacterized protein Rs2_46644 [Raphanus sativus]|nr:Uncharacterized protein Rs2_46644 [Raphanus sativus]